MEIYQMTNINTGEVYIGKNEPREPNYIGSGVELIKRIKNGSRGDWFKTILCQISSDAMKYNKNIIFEIEKQFILSAVKSLGQNKVLNVLHNKDFSVSDECVEVDKRILECVDLKDKGWSNVKIAERFSVSEGAIRKWLKKIKYRDKTKEVIVLKKNELV